MKDMNDYLRIREAAALLAVSEATIRRMLRTGTLQAVRIGKRNIRIRRASIEAFKGENLESEVQFND